MKILIINGPNLNMLGIREPEIYGSLTLDEINTHIRNYSKRYNNIELEFYQSNHEGEIIDKIQEAYYKKINAIIINPAGYTHTSVAIADAIKATSIPTVEVHLSDIQKRESYRHKSFIKDSCIMQIKGLGEVGYFRALDNLIKHLNE